MLEHLHAELPCTATALAHQLGHAAKPQAAGGAVAEGGRSITVEGRGWHAGARGIARAMESVGNARRCGWCAVGAVERGVGGIEGDVEREPRGRRGRRHKGVVGQAFIRKRGLVGRRRRWLHPKRAYEP